MRVEEGQDELGSITVQVAGLSPPPAQPPSQEAVSAAPTAPGRYTGQECDGRSALNALTQAAIGLEEAHSSTEMSLASPGALPLEGIDVLQVDSCGTLAPSALSIGQVGFSQDSTIASNVTSSQLDHMTPLGRQVHGLSPGAMDDSTTTIAEPDITDSGLPDFSMPWGYDYSLVDWVSPQSPNTDGFQLALDYDTPSVLFSTGPALQPAPRPHSLALNTTLEETQGMILDGDLQSPAAVQSSVNRMPPRIPPGSNKRNAKVGADTIQAGSGHQRSANAHQWATDWHPTKHDSQIEFPDMSQVALDILDAENLAYVNSLSYQCYAEIANYLSRHSGEHVHFRSFIAANLPPLPAMNCFVQLYFEHFQGIFPLLHQPTFDPAQEPWQLVLAVAAIGCRYSKLPGSVQFADALQELLRRAIADTVGISLRPQESTKANS